MATKETAEYEIRLRDRLSNPLQRATNKARGLDSAMGRVGKSAKKQQSVFSGLLKFNIYGAIASGVADLGLAFIKSGARLEQTRVAFETLIGSVEGGRKTLKDLTQFANVTPFKTEGVQKAGKTLLGFGVQSEALLPTLKVLGDISAGTGKDLSELSVIFGQIKGAGRLMGQDLLQLINAGFNPLQVISERTGKSMGELKKDMEKGAISFNDVQQAFIDVTSEGGRFFQMSEKQSKTLGGRWSTLVGKLQNGMAVIASSGNGFFGSIVEGLISFVDFFKERWSQIKEVFAPLGEALLPIKTAFSELFGGISEGLSVTGVLKKILNGIGFVLRMLTPLIRAVANGFLVMVRAAIKIRTAFLNWIESTEWAKTALKGFVAFAVGQFTAIATFAKNILSGVGDLLAGIFSGDVDQINKGLEGLKSSFSNAGREGAKAFDESFNSKRKNFFEGSGVKQKALEIDPLSEHMDQSGVAQAPAGSGKAKKSASTSVDGVSSGRPTTINVEIGKLIEQFVVKSETIEDMENKVKEMVAGALVSAVNDVNLIAN